MARDRVWSVEEKRAILEEYALAPWGSKGAVLRRHQISLVCLAFSGRLNCVISCCGLLV